MSSSVVQTVLVVYLCFKLALCAVSSPTTNVTGEINKKMYYCIKRLITKLLGVSKTSCSMLSTGTLLKGVRFWPRKDLLECTQE